MAKTLIFFRGPKTDLRIGLVDKARIDLSNACWISMDQVDTDPKRAHARCMNLTKQALLEPSIETLCVDNESIMPIHWQAYYAIAERNQINVFTVGVDIFDEANSEKLNLQLQNCPMFIASVDKYWCVKSNSDSEEVGVWLKTMKKGLEKCS